ncbi:hypothetical protein BC792_104138 [Sphingobacterium allocomposti]|uniref:Outer membrane protein with beta-barrel domain n=1 Tax=Sphingobacterium allocomposti TaxID=415956 RepID=A0A5S5DLV7_9SPHI|nr:hypothetical protein [Sphingobacterium composti Yoo et al. 2007 non Ten et al. 2007]TYP96913.1 hypothetical protein BC792_104138 [Sphingobacterium composti Yoo et al. 2007 non Ten et al. 2007]
MGKLFALLFISIGFGKVAAQTEADTLHFRKIYYFGGTGLSFPLGKTGEALTTRLFSGSAGLDIALKNPSYFLTPTLYMLTFGYDQLLPDPDYNYMVKNGRASFYMLSLAAGRRKQFKRLNTYGYIGPAIGLITEPRGDVAGEILQMSNKRSLTLAGKVGVGSDYKFSGFFIGAEIGYLYNFRKIEGNPVQFLTIMVGLKSDITRLSERVTRVIGIDTYKD